MALVLSGAIAGCGQSTMTSSEIGVDTGARLSPERSAVITVTDANGKALAGARVLIGMGLNNPFSGNFLTTGADGQVAIPSEWTGPMPITIEAKGHVRTTFFDRLPTQADFQLRRAPGKARYQITGDTTNYTGLSDGKHVNVGLIFPTFQRAEVPNIDILSLVSPETDPLTVMGKTFQLPSNLSVPTQRATYVVPVTLSKPRFRIIFDEPTARKLAVVHVRGVLQELVNDFQDGFSITKVANKVKFIGGTVKPHSGGPKPGFLSMSVNENSFTPSIPVTAPKYQRTQNMISVAVPEWDGVYSISDIKAIAAGGKMTLVAPRKGLTKGLVVSLLRTTREKESMNGVENSFFSAAITPANSSQAIDFLEMIRAPELRAGTLVLRPPKTVAGIEKVMTRAVLSHIEISEKDQYKLERKTPQWELYANDWTSSLTLPKWPENSLEDSLMAKGKMRWEAEFAGAPTAAVRLDDAVGVNTLEKVTHVTRSGLDF